MDDLQEAEALEAALDALGGSPTTAQILEVLKANYRDAGVATALKRTAGGGSSPFTGWTGDGGDPANVNANGGHLQVDDLAVVDDLNVGGLIELALGMGIIPLGVDPSAGGGVAAGTGTLGLRSTGQAWLKTGAGDTAWTQLGAGGAAAAGSLASADYLFTETAGAGIYTATLNLEEGSIPVDVAFWRTADWDADTAVLDAEIDTQGLTFFDAEPIGNPSLDEYYSAQINAGGSAGPFIVPTGLSVVELPTADTLTITVTTTGTGGTTGRLRVRAFYLTPTTTENAVKS